MLDLVHPWGAPVRSREGSLVRARVALESWEIAAYFRLRREIFAEEQRVFEGSDRDAFDADATPIVAENEIAGMPDRVVGVVRIYRSLEHEHTWFGGRLGVSRAHRRVGAVGTALITEAVSTAHGRGCQKFLATVQAANARYFEHHHFRRLEALELFGLPHYLMQADLSHYPASLASEYRARAS